MKLAKFLIVLPFLASCSIFVESNNRIQYFVDGKFEGRVTYSKDLIPPKTAILEVKRITQSEYFASNGIDVVKDINGGDNPSFSISLDFLNPNNGVYYHFPLINLSDCYSYNCMYRDDNEVQLYPLISESNQNDTCYIIQLHFDNLSDGLIQYTF